MGFWAFLMFGPRSSNRQKKVEKKRQNKKRKRDENPGVINASGLIAEDLQIGALDNRKASDNSTAKVVMKHKAGKKIDLISDLPTFILHRILSFLSREDAAKTFLLSKQWNLTRKSFPILEFPEIYIYEDKETKGKYLDYVDRSLRFFAQHKLRMKSVYLDLCIAAPDRFPVINTWLPLALHSGASKIWFQSYMYRLPETTFVVNSSLLCGSSVFFHLKKLDLQFVILSEGIVRDINNNCPNLTELVLSHFELKTLNISKPNKLVTLKILCNNTVDNVSVDAPSLTHFSFYGKECLIDLTSCCNLRKLELEKIVFTDLFHQHISRFPFLEVLDLEDCLLPQKFRISLQRLKFLRLSCFDEMEAIKIVEIDAPNLSKFELESDFAVLPQWVSTNIIPGCMDISLSMNITDGQSRTLFFLQIREYLASAPFDAIIFTPMPEFRFYEGLSFNTEELREAIIPPLVEVDCLNLENIVQESGWPTFLQGLIWTCHPSTVTMCDCYHTCIKIFCQMVKQSKCLRAAKIQSMGGIPLNIKSTGGIEHKQFDHVINILSSVPMYGDIVFKLEWDRSAIQGLTVF